MQVLKIIFIRVLNILFLISTLTIAQTNKELIISNLKTLSCIQEHSSVTQSLAREWLRYAVGKRGDYGSSTGNCMVATSYLDNWAKNGVIHVTEAKEWLKYGFRPTSGYVRGIRENGYSPSKAKYYLNRGYEKYDLSAKYSYAQMQKNQKNCTSLYKVTVTRLNIRSDPKKTSSILGTVNLGDEICVGRISFDEKWANTASGWVYKEYIKFVPQKTIDNLQISRSNNKIPKGSASTSSFAVWTVIFIIGVLLFIVVWNNNEGINNDKLKLEGDRIYDIRDVQSGLKYATKNFFLVGFIVFLVGKLVLGGVLNAGMVVLMVMVLIQSIIIYLANRRYVIDLDTGLIIFPRSDMENSILAILLLFPYWNLMRTQTIHSNEIENIYIDTKRWSIKDRIHTGTTRAGKAKYRTETTKHVRYTINIIGTFGSANLPFLERQKRDEVRNAIQQAVKLHTGNNVDRKVAEF